jgi:hypothetical protein
MATTPVVTAKSATLQLELKAALAEVADVMGGPDGVALANALETVVGKSLELFAETVLPGILRPFLSGAITHFGDELTAAAEKATDAGLAKLAAVGQPPPAVPAAT